MDFVSSGEYVECRFHRFGAAVVAPHFWHCFLRADRAKMTAGFQTLSLAHTRGRSPLAVAPAGGEELNGGARGNRTLGGPACHGDGRLSADSPTKEQKANVPWEP